MVALDQKAERDLDKKRKNFKCAPDIKKFTLIVKIRNFGLREALRKEMAPRSSKNVDVIIKNVVWLIKVES